MSCQPGFHKQFVGTVQQEKNEKADAAYLGRAILEGRAHEIMDNCRMLDGILAELGIADGGDDPVELIKRLASR